MLGLMLCLENFATLAEVPLTMGRVKKSTKKFEKNHLKRVVDQRHKFQKLKKDHQKKKARSFGGSIRDETEEYANGTKEAKTSAVKVVKDDDDIVAQMDKGKKSRKNKLENMSVDDFMAGGFVDAQEEVEEEEDEPESDEEMDEEEHKKQLENLKEKDPDFYKYLSENSKELLEFGESDDEAEADEDDVDAEQAEDDDVDQEIEEDEDEDEDEEEDEDLPSKSKKRKRAAVEEGPSELTRETLQTWEKQIKETHSLKTLRKIILAFRAAAHVNEEEGKVYAYKITDSDVFHALVVLALKSVPSVLNHHIPAKENGAGKVKLPSNAPKFAVLQPLIKSYILNLLHMVQELPDDNMKYLVVSESHKIIPYVLSQRKLMKDFSKVMLELWGDAQDNVRIVAFLALRKLATAASDSTVSEAILKGIYLTLVRNAKVTSIHTLPSINLMKNSAMEMYGLDLDTSYQLAFGYIRQLAIHLRNSNTIKSKESFKAVYNWQFIHCIDFWSLVLSTYCDPARVAEKGSNPLAPLIYPLVQVTLGVITLIGTPQYYPLRFHCIRALLRLTTRTGVFIPLAPYLLDIFDSSELKRRAKPSTAKPLDWDIIIRAPKAYLHTKVYQDSICDELVELLVEFYTAHCLSIAFPELAIPAIIQIKRFMKRSKNVKFNRQLQTVVERLEQNSKWIEQKRSKDVDFAPRNREKLSSFLRDTDPESSPLGSYLKTMRKIKEQRRKVLETANAQERKSKSSTSRREVEVEMEAESDSE